MAGRVDGVFDGEVIAIVIPCDAAARCLNVKNCRRYAPPRRRVVTPGQGFEDE